VQVDDVGPLNDLPAATLEMPYCILVRSLVSFSDCGRVMRDIVLVVVCGATMGLFVAMVGDFF
jgi:hypothetical protein